jgi:hypothetical protein
MFKKLQSLIPPHHIIIPFSGLGEFGSGDFAIFEEVAGFGGEYM